MQFYYLFKIFLVYKFSKVVLPNIFLLHISLDDILYHSLLNFCKATMLYFNILRFIVYADENRTIRKNGHGQLNFNVNHLCLCICVCMSKMFIDIFVFILYTSDITKDLLCIFTLPQRNIYIILQTKRKSTYI